MWYKTLRDFVDDILYINAFNIMSIIGYWSYLTQLRYRVGSIAPTPCVCPSVCLPYVIHTIRSVVPTDLDVLVTYLAQIIRSMWEHVMHSDFCNKTAMMVHILAYSLYSVYSSGWILSFLPKWSLAWECVLQAKAFDMYLQGLTALRLILLLCYTPYQVRAITSAVWVDFFSYFHEWLLAWECVSRVMTSDLAEVYLESIYVLDISSWLYEYFSGTTN